MPEEDQKTDEAKKEIRLITGVSVMVVDDALLLTIELEGGQVLVVNGTIVQLYASLEAMRKPEPIGQIERYKGKGGS